jgi:hypothetical protein
MAFACNVCGDGKLSMIQRPALLTDLVPVNTVFMSVLIHTVCFLNVASQPYSQSWPTESKEPYLRLGKMGYRDGLGDASDGEKIGVPACHVASIWEFNTNAFVDGCYV